VDASGERFKELVAQGAVAIGQSLVNDLQQGRIGSGTINSIGNFGGSLASAAIGGPLGILAAGGIGIFSGLLGSFLDGGSSDAAQAAKERRTAPTAIQISANVEQNNYMNEGIANPNTQLVLRQMTEQVISQAFEQIDLAGIKADIFQLKEAQANG